MKNVPSIIDGIEFVVDENIKISSLVIAELFDKKHKNVIKSIKNIITKSYITGLTFEPSEYIDTSGKKNKLYNLSHNECMFLTLGFTGKKADILRMKFIKAFTLMENYIIAEKKRIEIRSKAAMEAPEMTDALKYHRKEQGKDTTPFHYSNEFNMINRIVLGTTKNKWCENNSLKKENFRENLTPVQIEAVENLQIVNTILIESGLEYKIRKEKLTKIYNKKFKNRCLEEIVMINA